MKSPFFKSVLPALLGIFMLSVLLRVPTLNRPLSKHHEFCTAVALRVLQAWDQHGIDSYGFNPVMTYPGDANKWINNHANTSGGMHDAKGNYYYISHPPFAYYLPHFVFSALGVKPTVLAIQILNLALCLLSALFIYFTVNLLSIHRARGKLYTPGLVAYVIYLFNPATLWFLSNVYMSDMLVHVFFVLIVYTTLKMLMRRRFLSPKYIFFYTLLLFLMCYTSWLGYIYAGVVFIFAMLRIKANRRYGLLIAFTLMPTILALTITVWQYSSINGVDAYLNEMLSRYANRSIDLESSFRGSVWKFYHYSKALIFNYFTSYIVIYLLLTGFMVMVVSRAQMKILFTKNGYRFLILAGLTVVLLHAAFLSYSGHDFSTLYASVFLSAMIGIFYDKLRSSERIKTSFLNVGLIAAVVLMVAQYYYINRPGEISMNGDRYDQHLVFGEAVKAVAQPDEVIFIMGYTPVPQDIYYAERNIKTIKSPEAAMQWLLEHQQAKGLLLEANTKGEISGQQKLNTQ